MSVSGSFLLLQNSTVGHVLIIDDDPILREILAAFVEKQGAERVVQATNGDDAIQFLNRDDHQIDLIFCDLNMPDKDGVEILAHLNRSEIDTPVIIVSSADGRIVRSARELAKAYSLNLAGTLYKPIDFVTLQQVMSDLCHRRRYAA